MEQHGTIRKVDAAKGYGFIAGHDGTSYFFHRSNIVDGTPIDRFDQGDAVRFEAVAGPKGPRAERVMLT